MDKKTVFVHDAGGILNKRQKLVGVFGANIFKIDIHPAVALLMHDLRQFSKHPVLQPGFRKQPAGAFGTEVPCFGNGGKQQHRGNAEQLCQPEQRFIVRRNQFAGIGKSISKNCNGA